MLKKNMYENESYYVYKKNNKNITKHILKIRNIKTSLETFIEAPINKLIKTSLLNQKEAVNIIINAIKKNKKIGIYGDYDADGITAVATAISILKSLGARTTYYINNRFEEGFGLNNKGIKKLKDQKTELIITVDNGSNSIKEISKIKKLGIDIIITDHHEINKTLPNTIIINPKQNKCKYPNKEITGAGVIFKILLKVCEKYKRKNLALKQLDLVALGIVADMGVLLGENRIIVKNGLKLWNWRKNRINLKIFKKIIGLKKEISTYELSFIFAPILNSESRLKGKPLLSIEVLLENDKFKLQKIIKKLLEINEERKIILKKQIEIAKKKINTKKEILFIYDSEIKEGMAGLIANKFLNEYKKPVVILGKDNLGNIKGSGRSIATYNLKKELDDIKHLLLSYGGHELACGLTFKEHNLFNIKKIFEKKTKKEIYKNSISKKIYFEMEIKIKDINDNFIKDLKQLEPFGIGFTEPIFLIKNIKVLNIKYLKNEHSKFKVLNVDFLCFNKIIENNNTYHFGGVIRKNCFNGIERNQFIVKYILNKKTKINIL